ncbi:hypothetical protein [Streptomyces beihaiensis]|uniref:Uncharacterized protein n=1 Tax=Streptomyces beihaiensis TaxID=2984495 RepID=A0ABT3U468_9ACTN|nr:hypothetical protein [Streptomyces beihaiensis]MCX3063040.1 hypothetical protein [Streptomyces beihaiensis]
MRSTSVVRIVWGALLTAIPSDVLGFLPRTPSTPTGRAVVRVLGIRHVLQGAVDACGAVPAAWAAVPDALHAAGMAGLALKSGRWRTPAVADMLIASGFAVSTRRTNRRPRAG